MGIPCGPSHILSPFLPHSLSTMSSPPSTFTYHFTPMPRPRSANAPTFDGKNLTDFLDLLLRHGEHAGLTPDQLTPIIVAYCTPEVQQVVRYSPELQRDARSWHDAVSELREFYGCDDSIGTYTIADLHELCRGTCVGPPFRWLWDAEAYLRRFTQISGYLHELGFLTATEVQVYLVAGLPFETRKDVEARLPDANRGTDSPPTKRQVMQILRDLLRRDSFETFVTSRLFPTRSSSSPSSSDVSPASDSQSRDDSKPKRRSHRCFVCGGTNTHRLGPKFCPRTWELIEHGLARFNADGRLVSHDESALPMTRNSGGVAAHLFTSSDRRRRRSSRDIPQPTSPSVAARSDVPSRDLPSNPNPPQFPVAFRRPPSPVFPPTTFAFIPSLDPSSPPRSNLNPPQPTIASRSPPLPIFQPTLSSIARSLSHSSPPSSSDPPQASSSSRSPAACAMPDTATSSPLLNQILASERFPLSHASLSQHDVRVPTPDFKLNPPQPSDSSRTSMLPSPNTSPSVDSSHHPFIRVDNPKQLAQTVTLRLGDLLELSPVIREKLAEHLGRAGTLNLTSPSKSVCEPTPPPSISSSSMHASFHSIRKSFADTISPSTIMFLLLGMVLSHRFPSTSKYHAYYGYLFDMISFFISHISSLLMDSIIV